MSERIAQAEEVLGMLTGIMRGEFPGEDGEIFATAFMQIPDGSYEARVSYRQTQVIRMLFN